MHCDTTLIMFLLGLVGSFILGTWLGLVTASDAIMNESYVCRKDGYHITCEEDHGR